MNSMFEWQKQYLMLTSGREETSEMFVCLFVYFSLFIYLFFWPREHEINII